MHGCAFDSHPLSLSNPSVQALDQLDEAVSLEEALGYMEPPRLHQPARQCLGWVLLRAGKSAEAANVYQKVGRLVGWLGGC